MSTNHILVVDDSSTIRILIRVYLEKLGYTSIALASTAEEALQSLKQSMPNLVLMDINLGEGKNGIEVADFIMQNHGIPVIYVTSYSDEHTLSAAKQTLPYGFINKPIRANDLKVNIELALARSATDKPVITSEPPLSAINDSASSNTEYSFLSEAMDLLASGIVMIDEDLRIFFINKSACRILSKDFPLHIKDQQLQCTTAYYRREICQSIKDKTSKMLTIHHQQDSLHFLLFPLVNPFNNNQNLGINGSVLFLFDTSNDSNRIEEVVRTLYRLSPTEARLASMLVYNPYLADVSATLGISYHTARTHLKHIYQKTDTKKLPALIQKIISGPAGLLIKSTN